jgi:uncharacterized cupin superfamily protein
MKIFHSQNIPHVSKPEGLNTSYYLFDEYEVHYNEQLPNSTQTWHHHEKIRETLYIIEGELTAVWKENVESKTEVVKTGDLIETETNPHTFINNSGTTVKFLVIKQIPQGGNFRELFKTDKFTY